MMHSLQEFAPWVQNRVTSFMDAYLANFDDDAPKLKEAMRYGLLLGGKRSRPLLVYATGLSLGQKSEVLDSAAAAIECIHAYSLIHDDMPEMDNDKLRRGMPTVHCKFGQTTALLAGDALQTLGFEFISDPKSGFASNQIASLMHILAKGAGYRGMCGGQAIDLEAEHKRINLDELKLLHSKKTGALIKAAVSLGAVAANADAQTLKYLNDYASYVGLGFQVWDDVLDVIGNTEVMGKTQGSDQNLDKSTYPKLLGLKEAENFAKECACKACESLTHLSYDTTILAQFAKFAVSRDH